MEFKEIHLGVDIREMINHIHHAYLYTETVHVQVGNTCDATIFIDQGLGYETVCINLAAKGYDNIDETQRFSEQITSMISHIDDMSAHAYLKDLTLIINKDVNEDQEES